MKTLFFRYLRFSFIGTAGSLVNIAALFFYADILNIDYRIAGLLAIETRIINNFILNSIWTWKGSLKAGYKEVFKRFLNFNATSLGLSILITWTSMVLITETTGINHNYANLISLLIGNLGSVANFFLSNYLIFRKHRHPETGENGRERRAVNE